MNSNQKTTSAWKRVTVKVGSNVLARTDGTLDVTRMSALVDQVVTLRRNGIEVILVSSGAVAAGRNETHALHKLDQVEERQLYSAVGQAKLINRYYELFRDHGFTVGQVLTMKESFATRRHYLNQRSCMEVMLQNNVIPIVNENDTVSVTELMFTDNDELSGLIASMMDADALVILSNIDGIYTGSPADPASELIATIDPQMDLAGYIQASRSSFGRGGMLTKTNIARKVADEGIEVLIANGKRDNILPLLAGLGADGQEMPPCSRFIPRQQPINGVKKWIAHSEGFAKGVLHLNDNAVKALRAEKAVSLLPIGVTAVEGDFEKDDIVRLVDAKGQTIGVGKANIDAAEARAGMGLRGQKPVVHYDYLYLE